MTDDHAKLALDLIRRDGGTQPRDHISMEVAQDYAEAIARGAELPPIVVFFDGAEYWLADGFHRHIAHELLGLVEIEADVRTGSRRDAILYSVGANAAHGYRRTNADKRRAVLILLNDPEWSVWSDREIARRCAVSTPFVGNLRPTLSVNGLQIARTVERGGTVYQVQKLNMKYPFTGVRFPRPARSMRTLRNSPRWSWMEASRLPTNTIERFATTKFKGAENP